MIEDLLENAETDNVVKVDVILIAPLVHPVSLNVLHEPDKTTAAMHPSHTASHNSTRHILLGRLRIITCLDSNGGRIPRFATPTLPLS